MASDEDDNKPRQKIIHEIGQDLYLLSVDELGERMSLLTTEIDRLKEEVQRKRSSKSVADSLFKS